MLFSRAPRSPAPNVVAAEKYEWRRSTESTCCEPASLASGREHRSRKRSGALQNDMAANRKSTLLAVEAA